MQNVEDVKGTHKSIDFMEKGTIELLIKLLTSWKI